MKCPGCLGPMKPVGYKGVVMYECMQCSGRWFDGNELDRIKTLENQDSGLRWINFDVLHAGEEFPDAQTEGRVCPQCLKKMAPFRYMDSDIFPLRCAECKSVWISYQQWLDIIRHTSSWITKVVPRRHMLVAYLAIMVSFFIFLAFFLTLMHRKSSVSEPLTVPPEDSRAQAISAEHFNEMRYQTDMNEDMMRMQNEMMRDANRRNRK